MNMALRAAREASGKTQAQVAGKAGISETQYQNIEYGKSEPSAKTAIRISEALGVKSLKEYKAIFGDNGTSPNGN